MPKKAMGRAHVLVVYAVPINVMAHVYRPKLVYMWYKSPFIPHTSFGDQLFEDMPESLVASLNAMVVPFLDIYPSITCHALLGVCMFSNRYIVGFKLQCYKQTKSSSYVCTVLSYNAKNVCTFIYIHSYIQHPKFMSINLSLSVVNLSHFKVQLYLSFCLSGTINLLLASLTHCA